MTNKERALKIADQLADDIQKILKLPIDEAEAFTNPGKGAHLIEEALDAAEKRGFAHGQGLVR